MQLRRSPVLLLVLTGLFVGLLGAGGPTLRAQEEDSEEAPPTSRRGKRPTWAEREDPANNKYGAREEPAEATEDSPAPARPVRRPAARRAVAAGWSAEAQEWLAEVEVIARAADDASGPRLVRLRRAALEAVGKAESPDVLLAVSDVMSLFEEDSEGLRDYRAVARVQEALVGSPLLEQLPERDRAVVLHNAAVLFGPADVFEGVHSPKRSRPLARQALALFRPLPAEKHGLLAALRLQVVIEVFAGDVATARRTAVGLMTEARGSAGDALLSDGYSSEYHTLVAAPGGAPALATSVFRRQLGTPDDEDESHGTKAIAEIFLERFENEAERWDRLARAAAHLANGGRDKRGAGPQAVPFQAIPGMDPATLRQIQAMQSRAAEMMQERMAPQIEAMTERTNAHRKPRLILELATSLPLDPESVLGEEGMAAALAADPMAAMAQRMAGRMAQRLPDRRMLDLTGKVRGYSFMVDEPMLWGNSPMDALGMMPARLEDVQGAAASAAQWRRWVGALLAGERRDFLEDYEQCRAELRAAEDALVAAVFAAEHAFGNVAEATDEKLAQRIAAEPDVRVASKAVTAARDRLDTALKPILGRFVGQAGSPETEFPPNTLLVGLPSGSSLQMVWMIQVGPDGKPGDFVVRRAGEYGLLNHFVRMLATDGNAAVEQLRDRGADLFTILFPGEIGRAIAAADNVVFVAPIDWCDFPFGLLRYETSEGPRYLGEAKHWAVTESVWLLAENRRVRKPAGEGVLAGGISQFKTVFAASTRAASLRHLGDLPQAAAEATRVAGLFGTTPQLEAALTEGGVVAGLRERRLVHLATHGLNDPFEGAALAERTGLVLSFARSTGYPGLVLQPDQAGRDHHTDGFLQAWELVAAGPFRADVVALSACDSGRRYSVFTAFPELPRALLDGGVRAVQAARWKVDDAATALFMEHFARALDEGRTAAEANAAAVRALLADGRFAHPRFWAGFGIYGDPAARVK